MAKASKAGSRTAGRKPAKKAKAPARKAQRKAPAKAKAKASKVATKKTSAAAKARKKKAAAKTRAEAAHATLVANAMRAYELKNSAPVPERPQSRTSRKGMRPLPNETIAPEGALEAEGGRPALGRSRAR